MLREKDITRPTKIPIPLAYIQTPGKLTRYNLNSTVLTPVFLTLYEHKILSPYRHKHHHTPPRTSHQNPQLMHFQSSPLYLN